MKEKQEFGFLSQGYAPPRAESVAMSNEGLLCGSPSDVDGGLEGFNMGNGAWDGLGGGPESMTEKEGTW